MNFQCPSCRRSFGEPGFCPYDGQALASLAAVDKMTLVSSSVPVQDPHRTEVEQRRETFPLTPSQAGGSARPGRASEAGIKLPAGDNDNTAIVQRGAAGMPMPRGGSANAAAAAPVRPSSGAIKVPRGPESSGRMAAAAGSSPNPEPRRGVNAVSASEDPAAALQAFNTPRANEYDQLVGQTLDGRYYVQRKIGEGGMGVVFAARHAVIERPLAIKVLKREVMRDTATIRRFVQEAKAASRIGHPNIVDVTDFGTTPDGMTYSVMEYVEGSTLSSSIRHGAPFPFHRAIRIAAQICRALGAAHDKGIVHRDLKPENVFLVDRDGRPDFVKIVDFGIAKVTPIDGAQAGPRLTRAGSVFGTPEYMAPEQAAGRSDTDGRVDVYAMGVILYEMITGRVPHRGDSMVRTLAMQMLDPAEPLTKVRPDLAIPPELEAVVMKSLVKKREQRYQTMGELLIALEKVAKENLPPPIGVSVTGSPVYSLSPLPPGADPSISPSSPPAPLSPSALALQSSQSSQSSGGAPINTYSSGKSARMGAVTPQSVAAQQRVSSGSMAAVSASPSVSPSGRSHSPSQGGRRNHEPEFVTAERPPSFEHVWTPETLAPKRRKWPLVVLGAMIVGGAAGAVGLMMKSRKDVQHGIAAGGGDAGVASASGVPGVPGVRDAAVPAVATATLDASAPTPNAPTDAGVAGVTDATIAAVPIDGGTIAVVGPRHPPQPHDPKDPHAPHTIPRDAGTGPITTPQTVHGHGMTLVQVLTKPEGANLYVGATYRGPGGTSLEEPIGTKLEVQCKMVGYKPGTITFTFDGVHDAQLCALTRIKICINNIKNPFDDCEVDPSQPSPLTPVPSP